MLRKILTVMIILFAVVILANLFSQDHDCSYSNYNGTFTFEEKNFQNRDFSMCLRKFDEFKKTNQQDTILYRTCQKNSLHFWDYSDYLLKEKYKLPFMDWKEISARRGSLENKSGFQDF